MSDSRIKFSSWYSVGANLFSRKDAPSEVIFENLETGVRKTVIDRRGWIVDFPGLAHPDVITTYYRGDLCDRIRFYSHFSLLGDRYALLWQIQPEGRYWEDDDGFGGTLDSEIILYARLDDTGAFIEPFRLYSIDSEMFFGTDKEQELAQMLAIQAEPLPELLKLIPEIMRTLWEKITVPEPWEAEYHLPGSLYRARISLQEESGKWFVQLSVGKRYEGRCHMMWLKFLPLNEQRAYLASDQAQTDLEKELTELLASCEAD